MDHPRKIFKRYFQEIKANWKNNVYLGIDTD